ncbi:MAG: hypothetical protein JWQ16_245 [Novosphingobium sp.]|nr:hypothetical protein [Novosphingobium sp.]
MVLEGCKLFVGCLILVHVGLRLRHEAEAQRRGLRRRFHAKERPWANSAATFITVILAAGLVAHPSIIIVEALMSMSGTHVA